MNPNTKLSENVAVLSALSPASIGPGTVLTAWVPAANFHSISALIQTGVMGMSATIDAKFRQATDSSGTGAKDVAGKAIGQILKAAGDNSQAFLELRGDDLDGNNGFAFVALSLTAGTAASIVGAALFGVNPRFYPASDFNNASVVQIA